MAGSSCGPTNISFALAAVTIVNRLDDLIDRGTGLVHLLAFHGNGPAKLADGPMVIDEAIIVAGVAHLKASAVAEQLLAQLGVVVRHFVSLLILRFFVLRK